MILKFNEYVETLNEATTNFTYGDAKRLFPKIGLELERLGGDSYAINKGSWKKIVKGNLKHDGSTDERRTLDINTMKKLKNVLLDRYNETGDEDLANILLNIPWEICRLKNTRSDEMEMIELKFGGHNKDVSSDINDANMKYKDVTLIKISPKTPDSAYIMILDNSLNKMSSLYNTCVSKNDRRPLLDTPANTMDVKNGEYFFGYDNDETFEIDYYRVNVDGTLEDGISYTIKLNESKKCKKIW